MQIRTKTLLRIGTIFLILLVSLAVTSRWLVLGRFSALERSVMRVNVQRARNQLDNALAKLQATLGDWAPWDDTYRFMEDRSKEYISDNLVDSTFTNLGLSFILFFDRSGNLVFGKFFDLSAGKAVPIDAPTLKAVTDVPKLIHHSTRRDQVGGILVVGRQPVLVASQSIVKSNYDGPIHGALVMGRYLDGSEISSMGHLIQLPLTISPVSPFRLPGNTGHGDIRTAVIAGDRIASYGLVDDLNGVPAIVMKIVLPRTIYRSGIATWQQYVFFMALIGIIFIGVTIFVLEKTILRRIGSLNDRVDDITRSGDRAIRLVGFGEDEIGQLASSINGMLAASAQSHEWRLESERYLRDLLDSINAGVMVVNASDHRIVDVNATAAALIGMDREAMIGNVCHRFVCPREEGNCPITDLGQELNLSERKIITADGKSMPILKSVVTTERNGQRLLIESFIDIRKMKKLESSLRQAHKMEAMGTLAGGIAHDFNNILAGIIGFTEIAILESSENERVLGRLRKVLQAASRARALVGQILTFSRRTEVDARPLRIQPIVKEVTKLLRAGTPASIEIRLTGSSEATVIADPTQIHQVLMNLCTNGSQAMAETGGVLEIHLEDVVLDAGFVERYPQMAAGKYLCIAVRDTGHGMTPEVIDRIFDPFFTTKSKSQGTGMGLSVVHGIVNRIDGLITVESTLGKGTTFSVYLPRVADTVDSEDPEPVLIFGGTERVIFVDDEPFQVEINKEILENLGYRVEAFANPETALAHFQEHPADVDLVVTDLTMPHMFGTELARRMIAARPDLPIVLCTGFNERLSADGVRNLGIHALVQKPVNRAELARVIREVLDGKN